MTDAEITTDQQRYLLALAREAIQYYLETDKHLKVKTEPGLLQEKRGAFVTLKKENNLRGCIGYPLPHKPLYQTIIEAAILAATQDTRFPPMKSAEMEHIKIEISVLTLPEKIKDISHITIGQHGIIITQGLHRGLLLPQVPVEWDWDLETYLAHGCLKAGLSEDAWKKGAEIQIFSAQVFSE